MNIRQIEAFTCGNCGKRWFDKHIAESCCICTHCGKPKGHKYGNSDCEECRKKRWRKREIIAELDAELIPYDLNLVYHDTNGNWFFDVDDLSYKINEMDQGELPGYLYVSKKIDFHIDAHGTVESNLDEQHEDAECNISKDQYKKLQSFLDAWCADQKIVSWDQSMDKKVLVMEIVRELELEV